MTIQLPGSSGRVAAYDDSGAYCWDEQNPSCFTVAIRFIPGSYSEVGIYPDGYFHARAIPTSHETPDFRGMSLSLALRFGARPLGYLAEVADVR